MSWLHLLGGNHRRLQIDAFERLAAFDRHHAIRPCDRLPDARHEGPAGRRLKRSKQLPGRHAGRTHPEHEGGEPFPIVEHGRHASAWASPSIRSWAVKSSRIGVTDT